MKNSHDRHCAASAFWCVPACLVVIAGCLGQAVVPAPPPNLGLPTVFVVGDSTVRNGTPGQKGWGDPFAELLDRDRINVVNRARGGRSSRTFQTEGLWDAVLADAKAGDVVLIQFGHNDGGPIDDEHRARGSLRGLGEESREIFNPITKKQEVVRTFGWYMRKYIADARAKGVTPIVLSYVPRCPQPGKPIDLGAPPAGYALWAGEVAASEGAAFVDVYSLALKRLATFTPEEAKARFFAPDNTHTNADGARLNAEAVAEGLRSLEDSPLAGYLLPPAQADAAH